MDVHQKSLEASAKKSSSKFNAQSNSTVRISKFSTGLVDNSLTKENLSPFGSSPCARTTSRIRPPLVGMISAISSSATSLASQEPRRGDDDAAAGFGNIDSEIESIEKEISRLSLRLEYLRLEKAKRIAVKSAAAAKRGRFVPAKFMDPSANPRKIDELASAKKTVPRNRRLSTAPSEIAGTPLGRRGISLGPAEIFSGTKQAITPLYQSQSWRKSSFWKLQEVDELKVIKEQVMSPSPKLRKSACKLQAANSKQVVTTLRASKNKSVQKEDEFVSSVQPKELFKDGDKSATAKKPLRCATTRVVASRYKYSNGGSCNGDPATSSAARKRPLPDSDKESKTFDRKRISLSRE